jgi:hypothetical protein
VGASDDAKVGLRVVFNEGNFVGFLVGVFLGAAVALKGAFVVIVAEVTGFDDGAKDGFRVGCAGRERVSEGF